MAEDKIQKVYVVASSENQGHSLTSTVSSTLGYIAILITSATGVWCFSGTADDPRYSNNDRQPLYRLDKTTSWTKIITDEM